MLVLGMLQRSEPAAYANKTDALQYASAMGDVGVVEEAVSEDANVHADDGLALRLACWTGQLEVANRLLRAGADVHVHNDNALAQATVAVAAATLMCGGCSPRGGRWRLADPLTSSGRASTETWLLWSALCQLAPTCT